MALLQTEFRSQTLKRTVSDIQIKILNAMKENMPEISSDTLEEGGKVYYMNGKNGTEYDWFVNDHLPTFVILCGNRVRKKGPGQV